MSISQIPNEGRTQLAILRTDATGHVVAASEGAEALVGESVGRRCFRVVGASDGHGEKLCTPACAQALASGEGADVAKRAARVRGLACALQCRRVGDEVVVLLQGQPGMEAVCMTPLTERQLDVVRLVAEGLTNPQIADRLGIRLTTVRTHMEHVLERLDAHSRAEAIAKALASGQL